jgi:nitrogenase molybdenum-iron protein alpha/beta subunit
MAEPRKTRLVAETMEKCPRQVGEGFDPGKAQTVVCRLYGISRVLENLKNGITLVHGPKGCANYLQTEALCINRKLGPIVSTDVRERDIMSKPSVKSWRSETGSF